MTEVTAQRFPILFTGISKALPWFGLTPKRADIDPPQRAYVIGVPIRLRELRVSVVDRPGLLAALGDG